MIIGVLTIYINLPGISSLKQKRSIVKSVVERLRNRFNFSVSEVEANDSKIQAVIGLAVVGKDSAFISKQMETVVNFVNADGRFFTGRIEREIFSSDN